MVDGVFEVRAFGEAREFLGAVTPHLVAEEARNNLLLGIAEAVAAGRDYGDGPPVFSVIERDGAFAGAALQTPPHKVTLSPMDVDRARARGLASRAGRYPSGRSGGARRGRGICARLPATRLESGRRSPYTDPRAHPPAAGGAPAGHEPARARRRPHARARLGRCLPKGGCAEQPGGPAVHRGIDRQLDLRKSYGATSSRLDWRRER